MKKRLLACMLAICMITSMIPISALAEEDIIPNGDEPVSEPAAVSDEITVATVDGLTTADEFKTAIAAGGKVTLGRDIEISDNTAISITNETTLDLNGYNLKVTVVTRTENLFTIGAGGALTLTDTSTEQNGKISVGTCNAKLINVNNANASFTMAGGAIEATKLGTASASLVYVANGSFTMSGGTLTAVVGNNTARTVIVSNANASFTMSGGTIEAKNSGNVQLTALYIDNCASATLTDGTVRSENSGTAACYNLWLATSAKNVTLDGVNVEATGTSTGLVTAMYINGNASVAAIKGSTTISAKRNSATAGTVNALYQNSATSKIGSIEDGVAISATTAGTGEANALLTIGAIERVSGGIFTAETAGSNAYGIRLNAVTASIGTLGNVAVTASGTKSIAIYNVTGAIHSMTGGSYTALAGLTNTGTVGMENRELTESGGVWMLTDVVVTEENAVAQIGDDLYATLDGALSKVEENGTIILLQNLDNGTRVINLSGAPAFTLDLNGHTITSTAACAIYVAGTTLTLTDTAETKGGVTTTGTYGVQVAAGGSLTAEDVSVTGGTAGLYLAAGSASVSGGSYTGNSYGIQVAANATLTSLADAEVTGTGGYGLYVLAKGTVSSITGTTFTGGSGGVNNAGMVSFVDEHSVIFAPTAVSGAGTTNYPSNYNGFVKDTDYTGTPAKWVLTGSEVSPAANVAEVNGIEYATFAAALAAVPNTGGTINMLADCYELIPASLTVKNVAITIDLNGHTVNLSAAAYPLFSISGTGTLKITDSTAQEGQRGEGALKVTSLSTSNTYIIASTSTASDAVVLENVTLTNTGSFAYGVQLNAANSTATITNCAIEAYGTAVNINSGTLTELKNSEVTSQNGTALYGGTAGKITSVSGCEINGGTYGLQLSGASSSSDTISNTTITGAMYYGVHVNNANAKITAMENCTVSGTYGIYTIGEITSIKGGAITGTSNVGILVTGPSGKIGTISGADAALIKITGATYGLQVNNGAANVGTINYAKITGTTNYGINAIAVSGSNISIGTIENSTITGTGGFTVAGKITTVKDCTVTATAETSSGFYLTGSSSIDTIENCIVTGNRAGIYLYTSGSATTGPTVGEIKNCTVTATNVKKENNFGYALYLTNFSTVNKVTGGTFTGTNSFVHTNGNANANSYAVYVIGASAKIKSFGGKCVVTDDYGDTTFTGNNYGLRNYSGTVTIAEDADITGDNLYAAVWNYNAGKLIITGGTIGSKSCTYGVFNDQSAADSVPELTISGGSITGGVGVYNEGKIVGITDGTITGATYGLQNIIPTTTAKAEIGTFSGGTITGGQFGVYNEGTVETLSGGTYGGSIAGFFVGTGTVKAISGSKSISITSTTPWGVVYSGSMSTMPENFKNNGEDTISGAGNYSTDNDANYKDYGVQPTIVDGNYFYGNGLDITIDARKVDGEAQESGCVITWTNQVLGKQSLDTGETNWYIFAGSYGKKTGIDANNTESPLVTTPYTGNTTKDTITVTINGGRMASVHGGGSGNTLVKGTVQMDVNGGTMTSLRGGGSFSRSYWGTAGWGKGWSIVENVVININGECNITYSFEVAGTNAWVYNATVNLHSDFTVNQDEINVAGQSEYGSSSPMYEAAMKALTTSDGRSGTDLTITEQAELVKKLCLTYDEKSGEPKRDENDYLIPNPNGFGSVVVNAVVNCYADVDKSVHGGNYGGSVISYVDDLVVNVEEGYKLGNISIADTYGHVENTTINLSGTTNYIQGGRAGSAKNITVNVRENGSVGNGVSVGHVWGGRSDVDHGVGGLESYNSGGLVEGAVIRINNKNRSQTLNVSISGGVESLDYVCTGNVLLQGGNSFDSWNFIRPNAVFETTDFTWSKQYSYTRHYGQQGYLLVNGDLINVVQQDAPFYSNNANFILGTATSTTYTENTKGNGKLYIYQGQVGSKSDLPTALQPGDGTTSSTVNGITVVLGSLLDRPKDAAADFTPAGRINGLAVSEYVNAPIPATVVLTEADGTTTYTLLDSNGQELKTTNWELKFVEDSFNADPEAYKALSDLTLKSGDTLRYTVTRQGVTIFGTTEVAVTEEDNTKVITYDLNGSTASFTATQTVAGTTGTIISAKPTWSGYVFASWNTKADGSGLTYLPGSTITLAANITLYAQWTQTGAVTVTVEGQGETIVSGATVKLMRGETVVGTESATDDNGKVTFNNVPYGSYNVVVSYEDNSGNTITTTVGTDLYSEHSDVTVTVPGVRLNTEVDGDVHAAVEGLSNAISDQEKADLSSSDSGTVEITIKLTAKTENTQDIKAAISEKAGDDKTLTDYVDVTVTKTVTTVAGGTTIVVNAETIKTTADYQTITFEISEDLYAALAEVNGTPQNNILVYRRHEAESGTVTIEQLRKVSESRGASASYECYYIREIEGVPYITIRARNFSTYAFGVQATAVSEYVPSGGGSGGTVTDNIITVVPSDNGTVKPSLTSAPSGTEITLIITPDNGYALDSLIITDDSGNCVSYTDNGNGTYTFIMPASAVSVTAAWKKAVADPTATGVANWLNASDHIKYLNGYPKGLFAPNGNMTRAEAAQMFYNLLLEQDVDVTVRFSDVADSQWYAKAVNTLASLGMISGVGDGRFEPERAITRAEFTTIAMRFAMLAEGGENTFRDVAESSWYYAYVVGAVQYGWINGYSDGTFRPNASITRAEVTTIVNRMLGRSVDEAYVDSHKEALTQFSDLASSHWAYYEIMEAVNAHDYSKSNGNETWIGLN